MSVETNVVDLNTDGRRFGRTYKCILSQLMDSVSKWMVDAVLKLELFVARYHPLMASTYIRTPSRLAVSKAAVNVNYAGDEMFFTRTMLAKSNLQSSDSCIQV